jgi:hypothetical protein
MSMPMGKQKILCYAAPDQNVDWLARQDSSLARDSSNGRITSAYPNGDTEVEEAMTWLNRERLRHMVGLFLLLFSLIL